MPSFSARAMRRSAISGFGAFHALARARRQIQASHDMSRGPPLWPIPGRRSSSSELGCSSLLKFLSPIGRDYSSEQNTDDIAATLPDHAIEHAFRLTELIAVLVARQAGAGMAADDHAVRLRTLVNALDGKID